MTIPYHTLIDLLAIDTDDYEIVDDGAGADEDGQSDPETDSSGQMLCVHTVSSEVGYTHTYKCKTANFKTLDHANRPRRGLHTGLSSVKYWIESVKTSDAQKVPTMVVEFKRWADVDSSRQEGLAADLT